MAQNKRTNEFATGKVGFTKQTGKKQHGTQYTPKAGGKASLPKVNFSPVDKREDLPKVSSVVKQKSSKPKTWQEKYDSAIASGDIAAIRKSYMNMRRLADSRSNSLKEKGLTSDLQKKLALNNFYESQGKYSDDEVIIMAKRLRKDLDNPLASVKGAREENKALIELFNKLLPNANLENFKSKELQDKYKQIMAAEVGDIFKDEYHYIFVDEYFRNNDIRSKSREEILQGIMDMVDEYEHADYTIADLDAWDYD